jgi:triacylglycerol lipase
MAAANSPSAFAGDPFDEDPSVQRVPTPIWREALFGADWLALHLSPVFAGCGVPRGRGEPVVLVPGFLASDISMVELHQWLSRLGYRPYFSQIGRNADCPDHLATALLESVRHAQRETGQQVRLIGHSLGGMLARSVALSFPEHVAMVLSLGSPFRDVVRAHPMVLGAADTLRQMSRSGRIGANIRPSCFSGHCTCPFTKNMLNPEDYQVPHFAVFSRNDGVVDWQSCLETEEDLNDEVHSTHIGMAFSPEVYRVIGRRLAQVS